MKRWVAIYARLYIVSVLAREVADRWVAHGPLWGSAGALLAVGAAGWALGARWPSSALPGAFPGQSGALPPEGPTAGLGEGSGGCSGGVR